MTAETAGIVAATITATGVVAASLVAAIAGVRGARTGSRIEEKLDRLDARMDDVEQTPEVHAYLVSLAHVRARAPRPITEGG